MQVVMLVVVLSVLALTEGSPVVTEAKDRQILDGFLMQAGKVADILNPKRCLEAARDDAEETEANLWQVLPYLRMPLAAYQLTHDAKYLAVFVHAFENMRGAMTEGPDGYLGWYGKIDPDYADPANPSVRLDAIISSFGVTEALCDFLNLVSEDPALSLFSSGVREPLAISRRNLRSLR